MRTNLVDHDSGSQTAKQGDTEEFRLFTIPTVQSNHNEEIIVNLLINGTPVYMELDTGASVSLVSEQTWQRQVQQIPLQDSECTLRRASQCWDKS